MSAGLHAPGPRPPRPRVLFFAEAVTLAHVTRPLVLARSLDPERYDVHFACAEDDLLRGREFVLRDAGFTRWPLRSIPSARFLRATDTGARLYDLRTLSRYVEDDLRLIEGVSPALVVGDLRLSLCASAALARVPYLAISNAYWSPYGTLEAFPLPEFAWVRAMCRILGTSLVERLFQRMEGLVLAHHARPLDELRRRHGLPPFAGFREGYTHGDYTLYADLPALVPTHGRPESHRYIGPVLWSPPVALPEWWKALPSDRQSIYVSLGSSGRRGLLPTLLAALDGLGLNVLVATAGEPPPSNLPSRVYVADYLPGSLAAARSRVVVCNGGSATIYQALSAGVPVLGIVSNMDQLLAMTYTARAGAGLMVRAGDATTTSLRDAVSVLLGESSYRSAAARLSEQAASYDSCARFRALVAELVPARARTAVPLTAAGEGGS